MCRDAGESALRLYELAYICRIYGGFTTFDGTYSALLDKTGLGLDFNDSSHMETLLVWLRSWGCRQFAVDYGDLAAQSIRGWAGRWESRLPARGMTLDHLQDEDIQTVGGAYADLSGCVASKRIRAAKVHDVQVGPTGAAKILFAARPETLPPWDDPIRARWGLDGSARSYCKYLARVREQVKQLCGEAAKAGIHPEDIPQELGRPRSTLPKMIDEYNWITLTRSFLPPEPDEVAKWYGWSRLP
jgi:hypothetical protein